MLRRAAVLPIILLLGSFASAQSTQQQRRPDDNAIRGKLIIPNHDFDQRVEVRLERSTLQVIQTVYTDSSGGFEFRGLPAGSFYVSVTLEGYEPVHQAVEVYPSFGGNTVTIFMNKPVVEIRSKPTGLDAEDTDIIDVSQMKENLPKKAVQDYEKAIEEKKKGRLDSAMKLLEQAIQTAPNFYHAHNNLGLLYQAMKRYADAEKEYKRSREINAKSDRPLVNLGAMYIEQAGLTKNDSDEAGKLLDKALDALEQAVKINSHSANAYYLLATANYKSSFLEEAEAAVKKAHDIDPHLSAAHLLLANIYIRQEKWQDVIENLDAYLKENPKAPDRSFVEQMRAKVASGLENSTPQ